MHPSLKRFLAAAHLGVLLLAGCGSPRAEMQLSAADRAQLPARAVDLLLRAARSELADARGHAIEALVEVAPRQALPEFRAATQASDPLVRFAAFVAIGQVRDQGAAAQVDVGLRDPEAHVQLGAAFAAARLGGRNAAGVLVNALNSSREANLRCDAAFLLGELDEPRALPWLTRAARLEESHRVKVHIYAAMARLGDRDAVEALLAFLRIDTESRLISLQFLARLAPPMARDALEYELDNPTEFLESRLLAAQGLGALGSRAGFRLAEQNIQVDFKDAQDPNRNFRIRSLAAHALGAIGDEDALPLLHWLVSNESDERTQVAAAYAIAKITRRSGLTAGGY